MERIERLFKIYEGLNERENMRKKRIKNLYNEITEKIGAITMDGITYAAIVTPYNDFYFIEEDSTISYVSKDDVYKYVEMGMDAEYIKRLYKINSFLDNVSVDYFKKIKYLKYSSTIISSIRAKIDVYLRKNFFSNAEYERPYLIKIGDVDYIIIKNKNSILKFYKSSEITEFKL